MTVLPDIGFDRLARMVPLFPLAGALLLPRGQLPLNVFEGRYLQMVRDAMESQRIIGMVQPTDPEARDDQPALYRTGCVGRISDFKSTEDGRFLITLTGLCRFALVDELPPERAYRRALVSYARFRRDLEPDDSTEVDRDGLLQALRGYLDIYDVDADWSTLDQVSSEVLITSLAMLCPFAPPEKQALMEAPALAERARVLTALLEFAGRQSGDPVPLQ